MHFVKIFLITLLLCPAMVFAENPTPVKNSTVVMETTMGVVKIELFTQEAPRSVANFLQYVDESFYNGLIFHRVIPGFMAQGGGFEPKMKRRPPTHPPIMNEATNGLANRRGTLAMARTSDINSATSQFFINVADNSFLDHVKNNLNKYGYAVFGKVTSGMDVVDKIISAPTTSAGRMRDIPKEDIVILKMYRE
ncbi:peptidylprolyl isomerase [Thermodesulfobacteriota bacterium]